MVGEPYGAVDDPACYKGTHILINLRDLRTAAELEAFEIEEVGRRSLMPPPIGNFDPHHYRALHHHLFQDVYPWAGEYRTIRTAKGSSMFCYPEHIEKEMNKQFARLKTPAFAPLADVDAFIPAVAEFLGELNAIHPFREGNGRTQLLFIRMLGQRARHPFRSEAVEPEAFLSAMIQSFDGSTDALVDELERMLA
ncbi:cell filamentation protein [Sinorhizobium medicae]|uniref:Fic/DOC family protein n=1 Tax=Sinorhizobium medicae TaxID=110321 RepID=UPI0011A6C167|nr:Fic family protein [Sinorhizobium medicae]TWA26362.1 cell filamentation protein [Sinorhizobium medicae]